MVLNGELRFGRIPDRWDGRAAERIVEALLHVHANSWVSSDVMNAL
jgi:hypothetical protein